jgi:hypothetical protein
MKRTGFARKHYQRPPVVVTPIPRDMAERIRYSTDRLAVPMPKTAYVRDERLRDMCRGMACQHCGAAGGHAGVTWAHSNWACHGKGKGIKASDQYVAALCTVCHQWLDQGDGSAVHRWDMWHAAHIRTLVTALASGTWPPGLAQPDVTITPFNAP